MSLRDFLFSETEYEKLSDEQIDSLINFGFDFHFAIEYFLKQKGVNKRFRLFIDAIFHLNKANKNQIKDFDLAQLMGVSRETVGRIRKRFDIWQWENDINLVQISEGEYIREAIEKSKKFIYSPNSYQILFGRILIEAIFEAREMPLYKENSTKAIAYCLDKKLNDVNGNYSSKKRKVKKIRTISKQQQTIRKQIKTLAQKTMLISESQANNSMENELEDLHELLEQAFDELVLEVGNKFSPNYAREMQENENDEK